MFLVHQKDQKGNIFMKTSTNLDAMLREIDHKSYPAYKSLRGIYGFGPYALSIDHVQGDPFAAP